MCGADDRLPTQRVLAGHMGHHSPPGHAGHLPVLHHRGKFQLGYHRPLVMLVIFHLNIFKPLGPLLYIFVIFISFIIEVGRG